MSSIDLYEARFWLFVGVAILVLTPLAIPSARKWGFAGLNLAFLVLYTRAGETSSLVAVGAGLVLAWLLLKGASKRRGSSLVMLWLGGGAVLGLFLLHKLPQLGSSLGATRAESVLATLGFSYVALRLVDVIRSVRDGHHPSPDLPSVINYLLPFHMLAAGPIQAYDDYASQPGVPPPLTASKALVALERITWGLFKKFILASYIDRMFLTGFHAPMPYFLFEVQMNYVWLFLDFSGYSDVAVGLGSLMGVATPENFNKPYLARNVIEYWERWHISLSQFIRRNLFIPIQLALMRRTEATRPLLSASLAFTVSFLLCGLWHSISVPWFAWGVCQALGLVVCNAYKQALTNRLGRKGVKTYLANRGIKALAIFITFEFAAAVVAIATYPYAELSLWTGSKR